MDPTPPSIRELARRLIALEAEPAPTLGRAGAAALACRRLGGPLARLAGAGGYQSLLTRALALAKSEAPSLEEARVLPDGSLEGVDEGGPHAEAGVVVLSRLLDLLVTFIGEPLTMGLVADAWPDAPTSGTVADHGESS